MQKHTLQTCGLICALCLFTSTAVAQRGGGQRGSGTQGGGGGGCMRSSGNSASASNAITGQGFGIGNRTNSAFANMNRPGPPPMGGASSNQTSRNSAQNKQPTPQQFTLAAMRMDRNGDNKLCRDELTTVAAAVMAELNRRPQPRLGPPTAPPMPPETDRTTGTVITESNSDDSQKTETFVNRCLEFDRDKDGSLSVTETRIMAAALIKSLG